MHDSPLFPREPSPSKLASRPLRGCTGLALAGEADWTNRACLLAALAGLPARDAGDVHLDLSMLRFIDLFCTRELLALTQDPRGARLIVHQPPASLRRIIDIVRPQVPVEFTDKPFPEVSPAPTGHLKPHRAHATLGGGRRTRVPLAWMLP